jgi:hypothetical protein
MTEVKKENMPESRRFAVLLKRGGMTLLAVCLLAIGAYVLFINAGQAQQRTAKQATSATRSVPVVAVGAKTP